MQKHYLLSSGYVRTVLYTSMSGHAIPTQGQRTFDYILRKIILAYQSHKRANTQGSGFIGRNTRLSGLHFSYMLLLLFIYYSDMFQSMNT